jgi:hypothetical protein
MKIEKRLLEKQLNVLASEELLDKLRIVSSAAEIPISQIVREGVKEKIERLANEKPEVRRALNQILPVAA